VQALAAHRPRRSNRADAPIAPRRVAAPPLRSPNVTPSLRDALRRTRFRRQAAPVRFAFAERIDLLDGARWDALVADRGPLLQRAYFRELERALPDNLDLRYALLVRGDEPVAALAMQIVGLVGARLRVQPAAPRAGLRGLAERAVGKLVDRVTARALVVGNVLTYGNHGVAIRAGLEADPDVWHGVGEAAYRVRRAEQHAGSADFLLVKDLTAPQLTASGLLRDLGYRPVETEPDMVLTLRPEWRTHADYLAALTGKYRKNVRARVLDPVAAAGLVVQPITDVAGAAARLHELYLAVHANAALRPVTLAPGYWQALARGAGDRVRFAGVRTQDRWLGFVVTLLDGGDTAIAYHIGFDREAAAELPLYLRLLHRTIEDGIALGARRLSFGRTALEPKAMLGARPLPLHVWVRHRQPVLNKAMRALLGRIHHDDAPERNPFGGGAAPA
jgi:predicted N-acyltransferase